MRPTRTRSKPIKGKGWFIQDWGTYSNQTLVVVGLKDPEVIRLLRRLNRHSARAFVRQNPDYDSAGFVFHHNGRSLLWLPRWKNTGEDILTLIHETNHLIHYVLNKDKGMGNETEAQAYQQEYLFKNIRGRLNQRT